MYNIVAFCIFAWGNDLPGQSNLPSDATQSCSNVNDCILQPTPLFQAGGVDLSVSLRWHSPLPFFSDPQPQKSFAQAEAELPFILETKELKLDSALLYFPCEMSYGL